jgi:putative phosphoribosyl transferase
MMPFRDRSEAGRRLAKALAAYKAQKPVILALPRGGVPVAAEVAAVLDAPLDLILVRKIGAPMQPELAIAAVVYGGQPIIVRNEDVIQLAEVSEAEFEVMCAAELTEIERRRGRYLGDVPVSRSAAASPLSSMMVLLRERPRAPHCARPAFAIRRS